VGENQYVYEQIYHESRVMLQVSPKEYVSLVSGRI
jgi:hypothetical protein